MTNFVERKPSPIVPMHKRYEETMDEYLVIEAAERQAREGNDENEASGLLHGMKASCRETDAQRIAILHQVPDSWVEAMILQFHIVNAFDMQASCEGTPDSEAEALQCAIDTLFDFMCCEVQQDHGAIGRSFVDGANRAFFQRRRRTGMVEE